MIIIIIYTYVHCSTFYVRCRSRFDRLWS